MQQSMEEAQSLSWAVISPTQLLVSCGLPCEPRQVLGQQATLSHQACWQAARLIKELTVHNPGERPTAKEILRSELLPPTVGDQQLSDLLRSLPDKYANAACTIWGLLMSQAGPAASRPVCVFSEQDAPPCCMHTVRAPLCTFACGLQAALHTAEFLIADLCQDPAAASWPARVLPACCHLLMQTTPRMLVAAHSIAHGYTDVHCPLQPGSARPSGGCTVQGCHGGTPAQPRGGLRLPTHCASEPRPDSHC